MYGERRGVYMVMVGIPGEKRPFGRSRRSWEDNIKMDLQKMGERTGLIWLMIETGGGHL